MCYSVIVPLLVLVPLLNTLPNTLVVNAHHRSWNEDNTALATADETFNFPVGIFNFFYFS